MSGSTRRTQKLKGWGPPRRDDSGKVVCRWCGGALGKRRRTFCSTACVDEWSIRTNPSYVRQLVFKRDQGICALCGTDTMQFSVRKRAMGTGHLWQADHIVPVVEGGGECGLDGYQTLCTSCHRRKTTAMQQARADSRREHKALSGAQSQFFVDTRSNSDTSRGAMVYDELGS
jgi:5-methylcytosine-specific restriction protein A